MGRLEAESKLISILKIAHSGELGAIFAYAGHARSLKDPVQKKEILDIRQDEIHHRESVKKMLLDLGGHPSRWNEFKFSAIGKCIYIICLIGGWFIPMYGAGLLESKNIAEYEHAAYYAHLSGHHDLIDDLLIMAEVEWDHEKYFFEQSQKHFLFKIFPHWKRPGAREHIREDFKLLTTQSKH